MSVAPISRLAHLPKPRLVGSKIHGPARVGFSGLEFRSRNSPGGSPTRSIFPWRERKTEREPTHAGGPARRVARSLLAPYNDPRVSFLLCPFPSRAPLLRSHSLGIIMLPPPISSSSLAPMASSAPIPSPAVAARPSVRPLAVAPCNSSSSGSASTSSCHGALPAARGRRGVLAAGFLASAGALLGAAGSAGATRIEYYATVGERLCDMGFVKSGLGYCDVALGTGVQPQRGELINVRPPIKNLAACIRSLITVLLVRFLTLSRWFSLDTLHCEVPRRDSVRQQLQARPAAHDAHRRRQGAKLFVCSLQYVSIAGWHNSYLSTL